MTLSKKIQYGGVQALERSRKDMSSDRPTLFDSAMSSLIDKIESCSRKVMTREYCTQYNYNYGTALYLTPETSPRRPRCEAAQRRRQRPPPSFFPSASGASSLGGPSPCPPAFAGTLRTKDCTAPRWRTIYSTEQNAIHPGTRVGWMRGTRRRTV